MMISTILKEFQVFEYHTILRGADLCAHLNLSVVDCNLKIEPKAID
jgi:hypothetical protein